jgi:hypothetical protein
MHPEFDRQKDAVIEIPRRSLVLAIRLERTAV